MEKIYVVTGIAEGDSEASDITRNGSPIEAWPSRELAEAAMALWVDSGVERVEIHEVELHEKG